MKVIKHREERLKYISWTLDFIQNWKLINGRIVLCWRLSVRESIKTIWIIRISDNMNSNIKRVLKSKVPLMKNWVWRTNRGEFGLQLPEENSPDRLWGHILGISHTTVNSIERILIIHFLYTQTCPPQNKGLKQLSEATEASHSRKEGSYQAHTSDSSRISTTKLSCDHQSMITQYLIMVQERFSHYNTNQFSKLLNNIIPSKSTKISSDKPFKTTS